MPRRKLHVEYLTTSVLGEFERLLQPEFPYDPFPSREMGCHAPQRPSGFRLSPE